MVKIILQVVVKYSLQLNTGFIFYRFGFVGIYFIVKKIITNSISNSFPRFMFLILPQKYLEAIKCNKKLISEKM